MNVIIYLLIFMIGTVFGSFLTLAVYRLPLKQDIMYTRSYCPNCNHRLEFLDLIPVLSYIFLKGKCRYCGQKIRIRYLIFEVLTGTLFVVSALSMNLDIYNLTVEGLIYFGFMVLYMVGILLIAGICKETKKINKPVVYFNIIISVLYMIYLYIVGSHYVYKYVIYLLVMTVILTVSQKIVIYVIQKMKNKKIMQNTAFMVCYSNIAAIILLNIFILCR
ncbi:MAG: prepilin peptidase [Clostridia bacterium]|nr:prepilin peptidase [Clostridia bacterium]